MTASVANVMRNGSPITNLDIFDPMISEALENWEKELKVSSVEELLVYLNKLALNEIFIKHQVKTFNITFYCDAQNPTIVKRLILGNKEIEFIKKSRLKNIHGWSFAVSQLSGHPVIEVGSQQFESLIHNFAHSILELYPCNEDEHPTSIQFNAGSDNQPEYAEVIYHRQIINPIDDFIHI